MASKPTLAMIPGVWHTDACFRPLHGPLSALGFQVNSTSLRSINNKDAELSTDIAGIQDDLFKPLIEIGKKEVVLIAHSFGGVPGSCAVNGWSHAERAKKGLQGGLIGIIYICALIPVQGGSLLEILGRKWAPFARPDEPEPGLVSVEGAKEIFYNDVPEPTATEYVNAIQNHGMKAFLSPVPSIGAFEPLYDGQRAYIHTHIDNTLPISAQEQMLQRSGVDWITKDIDTGHSPFVSQPEKLASVIDELVNMFLDGATEESKL